MTAARFQLPQLTCEEMVGVMRYVHRHWSESPRLCSWLDDLAFDEAVMMLQHRHAKREWTAVELPELSAIDLARSLRFLQRATSTSENENYYIGKLFDRLLDAVTSIVVERLCQMESNSHAYV